MPALGVNAVLYYLNASADWVLVAHVRDLVLRLEAPAFDSTPRDAGGWKTAGAGLLGAALEFDMLWVPGDPALAAFRDAFVNGTPITLQALDGDVGSPTAGSAGLQLDCAITRFELPQVQREAMTISITAKPTISDTDPAWVEALIDIDNGETVYDIDASQLVVVGP